MAKSSVKRRNQGKRAVNRRGQLNRRAHRMSKRRLLIRQVRSRSFQRLVEALQQ